MSLANDAADEEPDPPPSPWRWVVAFGLAAVTLGAGWLVQRENERANHLRQVNTESAADAVRRPAPSPAPQTLPPAPPAAVRTPDASARPRRAPDAAVPVPAAPTPAASARLRITADVAGAFVFLDRKYIGVTPLDTTEVGPGSYHLKVAAEGVGSVDQPLEVAASGPTEVNVALRAVRLDASVDVVHKHAMGSCEGRLVATPAGLRYETRDADAFAAPLGSLEVFDLDYLKKVLRVKLRRGRTYNFTTKADTADPLVVFQHAVDEARRKLAAGREPDR